jgi:hypothetical protein
MIVEDQEINEVKENDLIKDNDRPIIIEKEKIEMDEMEVNEKPLQEGITKESKVSN